MSKTPLWMRVRAYLVDWAYRLGLKKRERDTLDPVAGWRYLRKVEIDAELLRRLARQREASTVESIRLATEAQRLREEQRKRQGGA